MEALGMATYKDLRAWRAAKDVAKSVFDLADRSWSPRHACVYDQLRRSALSVPLNIAEGHAQGAGPRCRSHFRIAFGSAVETVVLLDFLSELGVDAGTLPDLAGRSRSMCYRLWERSRSR